MVYKIPTCCGKIMAAGQIRQGIKEPVFFCFTCKKGIPIVEEKRVFKSPHNLTVEEKRILTNQLRPLFKEFRDQIAEMVATWASENIPRLLKEIEEEKK